MLDVSSAIVRMRGATVYIDTNIFIYVLNNTPVWAAHSLALIEACATRQI